MHWRRPPRWWPLGLSLLTLAVSLWILVAWWDPITASHPAYFIALRLVAVASVGVVALALLTRRTAPVEREPRPRWRVVLVRAVATGLVAAVIGKLIAFPGGALAAASPGLRVGSAAIGFAAYLVGGKRMIVGIATAEALLCLGLWAGL